MGKVDDYLKKNGFIIPSNEIYGGCRGLYDYGHLGVLLKKNIQKCWEEFFVTSEEGVYFMEGSILGSEACWTSSGHVSNFHDILVDCKNCKRRYREDHLENEACPNCGGKKWTNPREFNLIFKTQGDIFYLRPETAQSIFINFKNMQRVTSAKVPFAIAQVGKSFRNEITMHNSIFRTLEFEQMECEWFVEEKDADFFFEKCLVQMKNFLIDVIGIPEELIRIEEIAKEERAHYSKRSVDVLFNYESGWGELWGLANRGDYDLTNHQTGSGKSMEYLHQSPNGSYKFIPHVIEHSIGLNRLMYALISACLVEEPDRTVLRINPKLAIYKFAILPLTKYECNLATFIHKELIKDRISVLMLQKGSIGKRYKSCDEIGIPCCITLDQNSYSSQEDPIFTIRDRDSKEQITISLSQLKKQKYQVQFKS